jgi:CBS domain containing-hemolysin-like protein
MMMTSAALINLLLAICLLAANAFYVAAEFALVKSRGFRINAMADEGRFGARLLRRMVENVEAYLACCILTDVEIEQLIEESAEHGRIEEGQAEYIQNVFRFGELRVSDVMINRTNRPLTASGGVKQLRRWASGPKPLDA